jgi:Protein of unknown function (DUF2281)
MMKPMNAELKEINHWDEVADFASEAEEAEFWSTHCLGDTLLMEMQPLPDGVLPAPREETLKSQLQLILDTLPENLLAEVKDFAEFLQQKQRKAAG